MVWLQNEVASIPARENENEQAEDELFAIVKKTASTWA